MEWKGGGLLLEYIYWSSCTTVARPSYLIWFCVRLFCIRYRGNSITGLTALMTPQALACLINCTIDWGSREEIEKDARLILLCLFWGSRCKSKGEVIRSVKMGSFRMTEIKLYHLCDTLSCLCTLNSARKFLWAMSRAPKHLTFLTCLLRTSFSFPELCNSLNLTFLL